MRINESDTRSPGCGWLGAPYYRRSTVATTFKSLPGNVGRVFCVLSVVVTVGCVATPYRYVTDTDTVPRRYETRESAWQTSTRDMMEWALDPATIPDPMQDCEVRYRRRVRGAEHSEHGYYARPRHGSWSVNHHGSVDCRPVRVRKVE